MIFIRHFFEALLNPYFIILVILGFLIAGLLHGQRNKGFVALLLWGILFFLSTGWVAEGLTNVLEKKYPVVATANPSIKWVVILSGGQAIATTLPASMLISGSSLKRLIEGVRLFRQLPKAKLVLSGGGYNGNLPEADNLALIADWFAIDRNKMILESRSENTASEE
ncbi:MAG: YdcF family protein, partial [Cyanobacteria bacterium]|nr:YdcF family protein [Cyanobacteriota bacterium]